MSVQLLQLDPPARPWPLSTGAPMSVFSDNELARLAGPRRGRLATTGPDGP